MKNTSTIMRRPIKLSISIKEKESNPVKPVVKLEGAYQNDWRKEEDGKMTSDYLNEKLYYFYNNGGPIMDI